MSEDGVEFGESDVGGVAEERGGFGGVHPGVVSGFFFTEVGFKHGVEFVGLESSSAESAKGLFHELLVLFGGFLSESVYVNVIRGIFCRSRGG